MYACRDGKIRGLLLFVYTLRRLDEWQYSSDASIIDISLGTSYNSINPNACGFIGWCLKMIAASFCFNNECTMWSTAF